jgi:hypothetical protein
VFNVERKFSFSHLSSLDAAMVGGETFKPVPAINAKTHPKRRQHLYFLLPPHARAVIAIWLRRLSPLASNV